MHRMIYIFFAPRPSSLPAFPSSEWKLKVLYDYMLLWHLMFFHWQNIRLYSCGAGEGSWEVDANNYQFTGPWALNAHMIALVSKWKHWKLNIFMSLACLCTFRYAKWCLNILGSSFMSLQMETDVVVLLFQFCLLQAVSWLPSASMIVLFSAIKRFASQWVEQHIGGVHNWRCESCVSNYTFVYGLIQTIF